jgi:hypothetical protein
LEESSKDCDNVGGATTGFIRTNCAECGKRNRVEVVFPSSIDGFEDTEYTCSSCGTRNVVTDPHKYGSDGRIMEASYGGAYDIGDDQFFTRDDLNEFAEEVLSHVLETFNGHYYIGGCWFEHGHAIVNVQDYEYNEFEVSIPVEMRKIRRPSDLKLKYALGAASKIIKQIKQLK